jgi:tetratricopeptide (TPR) repeat protein
MDIFEIAQGMKRVIGQSPNRLEDRFGTVEVPGDSRIRRRIGEQGRNTKPKEAGAFAGPSDQRMEEAMALHKKEEAICLELGNQDGLQRSYGNQALVLKAWGQLEEAMALHKKEEAICLELGTKEGLAYCYWNWGLLERALGNSEGEQAKLSTALALFRELGMPRERDAVEAELAKTPSAGTSGK